VDPLGHIDLCWLHGWVGAGISQRDVIRLQGTFILFSFFNLLLTDFRGLSCIPLTSKLPGGVGVFGAWEHAAHAGSHASFQNVFRLGMKLG